MSYQYKIKIINDLNEKKINISEYISGCKQENIGKVVCQYLISRNLRFDSYDIRCLVQIFKQLPNVGYIICLHLVKLDAKYDFANIIISLTSIQSSKQVQASMGLLFNREINPVTGNISTMRDLIISQYSFIKKRVKSYKTLGALCDKLLPEEDKFTIVDGGAAQTDMLQVFDNIPNSRIKLYLFEPVPELAEVERQRFNGAPVKTDIFEVGLWHDKANRDIALVGNPSIFPRGVESLTKKDFASISLDSLNNIFEKEKKDIIDFVKLNIEGAELSALQGMTDFLDNVMLLKTEVKFIHDNQFHPKYIEIAIFLEQRGFRLIDMAKPKYGFTPDYLEHYPQIVSVTDSWLAQEPIEAHWIYRKVTDGTTTTAKELKKIIALEAYGKIPRAISIFKQLLYDRRIPKYVSGVGYLSSAIEDIADNYLNELKRHK